MLVLGPTSGCLYGPAVESALGACLPGCPDGASCLATAGGGECVSNAERCAPGAFIGGPSTCGVGACKAEGRASCVEGRVVDSCQPLAPTTDVDATCDGVDDDCDGQVDEDVAAPRVTKLAAFGVNTCAVVEDGKLYCWGGRNEDGQLGLGHTRRVGEVDTPADAGLVPLGEARVVDVSVGNWQTCALLEGGALRCWGANQDGTLGLPGRPTSASLGDDEPVTSAPPIEGLGVVTQVSVGWGHVCALNSHNEVFCWGGNRDGVLGLGHTRPVSTPGPAARVSVGGLVTRLRANGTATCVVLSGGSARCWGQGTAQMYGREVDVGVADTPAQAGDVLGLDEVADIWGGTHGCALLVTGDVRCWGSNWGGMLGAGHDGPVYAPSAAPYVTLPRPATALAYATIRSCARLDTGAVQCWGKDTWSYLGHPERGDIGDDELVRDTPPVDLGGPVSDIVITDHGCAVMANGDVRCFGSGASGALGRGDVAFIGDDESPADVEPVPIAWRCPTRTP
ncbi:MAG: hypothetical protein H6730_16840 [Deltaproteobacteria bacterium]|nr:hypothetical protein [Deltaproteobacteria bacterium]